MENNEQVIETVTEVKEVVGSTKNSNDGAIAGAAILTTTALLFYMLGHKRGFRHGWNMATGVVKAVVKASEGSKSGGA